MTRTRSFDRKVTENDKEKLHISTKFGGVPVRRIVNDNLRHFNSKRLVSITPVKVRIRH